MKDIARINHFLQEELDKQGLECVKATTAAEWLDRTGLLKDSKTRPGKPLRDLLRQGLVLGQAQELNNRWFICKTVRKESNALDLSPRSPADNVQMEDNPVERRRSQFKPPTIKVLFVGESAPVGGTFFYDCNSNLYDYTLIAFSNVFGDECGKGKDFLNFFKEHGYYLDDLCLKPVNDLDKAERRGICRESIQPLAERIKRYNPNAIVVVKLDIAHHVRKAAILAGIDTASFHALPFPAMGHQWRYVSELTALLPALP